MGAKKNKQRYQNLLILSYIAITISSFSVSWRWWYDRFGIYKANYFL